MLPPLVMNEAEGRMVMSSASRPCGALPGEARRRISDGNWGPVKPPLRHFLQFKDFSRAEHEYLFRAHQGSRTSSSATSATGRWKTRTLAMIFEKPSTRTRMSFEWACTARRAAIYLYTATRSSGRGEPVEDAAQVISRMCT